MTSKYTLTEAERFDRMHAVICPFCMTEILAGSPRAEVLVCGSWTVAHLECEQHNQDVEDE